MKGHNRVATPIPIPSYKNRRRGIPLIKNNKKRLSSMPPMPTILMSVLPAKSTAVISMPSIPMLPTRMSPMAIISRKYKSPIISRCKSKSPVISRCKSKSPVISRCKHKRLLSPMKDTKSPIKLYGPIFPQIIINRSPVSIIKSKNYMSPLKPYRSPIPLIRKKKIARTRLNKKIKNRKYKRKCKILTDILIREYDDEIYKYEIFFKEIIKSVSKKMLTSYVYPNLYNYIRMHIKCKYRHPVKIPLLIEQLVKTKNYNPIINLIAHVYKSTYVLSARDNPYKITMTKTIYNNYILFEYTTSKNISVKFISP